MAEANICYFLNLKVGDEIFHVKWQGTEASFAAAKMRNFGCGSEVKFTIRKLSRHKILTEFTELLSVIVFELRQI
jgi:hypothetical protein